MAHEFTIVWLSVRSLEVSGFVLTALPRFLAKTESGARSSPSFQLAAFHRVVFLHAAVATLYCVLYRG